MDQKTKGRVLLAGAIVLAVYGCIGLWVRSESTQDSTSGLSWGVKDKDGKVLLDAKYEDVWMPSHGDVVHLHTASGHGLASAAGKILLEPKYSEATYYPRVGLAKVCIEQDKRERCAIAAGDGKIVTPFRFDSIRLVGEGPFPFRDGEVHGYVDASGKILNQGRFRFVETGPTANGDFSSGVAWVEQDGKKVVIDRQFSVVHAPRVPLLKVTAFMNGAAAVCEPGEGKPVASKSGKPSPAASRCGKTRLIDRSGRDLLPVGVTLREPTDRTIAFDASGRPHRAFYTVVQGNKRGIVDDGGRIIVPVNYSGLYLKYAHAGFIVAYTETRNNRVFDRGGRQVLQAEKDERPTDSPLYMHRWEDLPWLKVNANTGLIAFRSKEKWQVVDPQKRGVLMSADGEIGLTNRPDRFITSAADKSGVTYRLVDQHGKAVSPAIFSNLQPVSNGADALVFRSGATAGVLDHDGRPLFEITGWVVELPRSEKRLDWTRHPGSGAYAFPSESPALLAANKLSLLYGNPRDPGVDEAFGANRVLGVEFGRDLPFRALVGAFLLAGFLFGWWVVMHAGESRLMADAGRLIRFLTAVWALTFLALQTGSLSRSQSETILVVLFLIPIAGYCAWRWRSWQRATRWLALTLLWPEALIVLAILDQLLFDALREGPVFFALLILGLVALGATTVYTARKSAAAAPA